MHFKLDKTSFNIHPTKKARGKRKIAFVINKLVLAQPIDLNDRSRFDYDAVMFLSVHYGNISTN